MKKIMAEVEIQGLDFPNKAFGFYEGAPVTVQNALPGQILQVQMVRKRGAYQGRTLAVVHPSPLEVAPECEQFGVCGGCTYQSVAYDTELQWKEEMVLKLLAAGGIRDFEFLGMQPAPSCKAYRNKMEFSFGDQGKDQPLNLGLRKRNSYYEVASAADCKIVDADYRTILAATLAFFREANETFYHRMKKEGALRHLIIRKGFFTDEILVNLTTSSTLKTSLDPWVARMKKLDLKGKLVGILHTVNDSVADVVQCDAMFLLEGRDYFYDRIFGLQFKISPFSFFQTNTAGAERLYQRVLDFMGTESKVVLDLYCGTGTIAQVVAQRAKKVLGVEIVPEAVEAARENAQLNQISNCSFLAGDVLKVVDEIEIQPDLLILDPPREGIHPKAIRKIMDFSADRLIYVSCKPTSLVRDLQILTQKGGGYVVKKIALHDMFARTYHVETVILLHRKNI